MRILMLCHVDAPWTPLYSRYFVQRGDVVKVLSFSPGKIDGVDAEFIGNEPFDIHKDKHLLITRVPRINRIIRSFQPDLVFAGYVISNGLSAVLSFWKGPIVVSAQGSDVLPMFGHAPTGWKHRARQAVVRFVLRRVSHFHVVSRALEEELVRLGAPRERIGRFPTGVNLQRFFPDPAMPRDDGRTIICTRKHRPIYDNETLLDACIELNRSARRFKLLMVGGGEFTESYRQRVQAGGISEHVVFTGNRPHEELPGLLRSADVYVSASLSDGTSASLLEALASGLFPVVSRIRANEPWVTHGETGLMFDCGKPDQLAGRLQRALDDAALRRRAFEANRRLVEEEGDFDKSMRAMAELCERAVREGRR